jgi:heme A synthase
MTPTFHRPVPRWVHVFAWFSVAVGLMLLALGGFVTSFRVGMADPVWPTEPWFLLGNSHWEFGFVIEHTHRLFGWILGAAVSILAIAVWWTEPRKNLRWAGLIAIVALLAAYGGFHRGMGASWNQLKTLAETERGVDPKAANFEASVSDPKLMEKVKNWPTASGLVTLALAIAVVACGVVSGLSGMPGGWLRAAALITLVAVMIQGLLGGFRVFFNALAGQNLAAIHGAFGQLAFCALVAVAVLAGPRRAGDALAEEDGKPLATTAWLLACLLVLQLFWAVMLRHGGSALSQRLHILTAFAVAGFVVYLFLQLRNRMVEPVVGVLPAILLSILGFQLLLGVEAYLGKFAAIGPQAQKLPEFREVTRGQAIIRTSHQLVGCGLLAVSLAMAIRLGRAPVVRYYDPSMNDSVVPSVAVLAMAAGRQTASEAHVPDVARMAMDPPPEGLLR